MAEPRDLGESYERCVKELAVAPGRADVSALIALLIQKGVFTEAEFLEARRKQANELLAVERERVAARPSPRDPADETIVRERPP